LHRSLNSRHSNSGSDHTRFSPQLISEFDENIGGAIPAILAGINLNLKGIAMAGATNQQDAERIYRLWDDALGKKDLEASLRFTRTTRRSKARSFST
jgi:hypothetical protein